MSETKLNEHLKSLLGPYAVMSRLESPLTNQGISDWLMSFRKGPRIIVESKYLPKWPVKPDTPINLRHFTKEQKLFLRAHGRASGGSFVILQVQSDIFVFDYRVCPVIGRATKAELFNLCVFYWSRSDRSFRNKSFKDKLVSILTSR